MSLELDGGKHVLAMTGEITKWMHRPWFARALLHDQSTWGPTAGSRPRNPAAAVTKPSSTPMRIMSRRESSRIPLDPRRSRSRVYGALAWEYELVE